MSYEKFVLLSLVVVGRVLHSAARPMRPRLVDIDAAINNTVCPMRLEIDEDPTRIPRKIKQYKCMENPHDWCVANHVRLSECCGHHSQRLIMECVEMRDKFVAKYRKNRRKFYEVSVGCSCMVSEPNEAATIPPPT